jgi:hypothetical protein
LQVLEAGYHPRWHSVALQQVLQTLDRLEADPDSRFPPYEVGMVSGSDTYGPEAA